MYMKLGDTLHMYSTPLTWVLSCRSSSSRGLASSSAVSPEQACCTPGRIEGCEIPRPSSQNITDEDQAGSSRLGGGGGEGGREGGREEGGGRREGAREEGGREGGREGGGREGREGSEGGSRGG